MSKIHLRSCAIAQLPVFRKGKPGSAVLGMTRYDSFCDLAGAVEPFYDESALRPPPCLQMTPSAAKRYPHDPSKRRLQCARFCTPGPTKLRLHGTLHQRRHIDAFGSRPDTIFAFYELRGFNMRSILPVMVQLCHVCVYDPCS